MTAAMVGESVGNYRVTSLLGEGGMGAVYVAEHPGIGRRVAVKVLLPELAKNQEMITRFFNEARAANAIRHPGIVEVLDFGTLASGASYIVMELLEGESLATRLSRGRLSPEAAVEIALQAAGALGAAHTKEIVHRDLKPDNLYLVPDSQSPGRERVKVLDFGIAKLTSGLQAGASSVKTRTGVIMGTPIYMSPEQCRGTRVTDHRSDLYSLGVILFEMVCGTPPFVSDGQGELIHMHIAEAPPFPRQLNPEVSPWLEAAILRTLAKDPAQRFQSMDELADALRAGPARDTGAPRKSTTAQTLAAPQAVAIPRTLATPVSLPSPGRTLVLPEDAPGPPPQRSRASSFGKPAMTTLSASAVTSADASPRRRSRALPIVLGVLVVAAAGGVYLVVQKPWESPAASADLPAASTPSTAPSPPAPQVAPSSARPAPNVRPVLRSVSVSVKSKPAGAQLTRESDGAVLGVTPFDSSAPAHAGVERVKVDLPGYAEELLVLPRNEDVDLSLALKPIPAGAAAGTTKKRPHAQHAPHAATHVTPGPSAPEPTAEPVPL